MVLKRDTKRCLSDFEAGNTEIGDEERKEGRSELQRTLVWTDIADTIEGFLLMKVEMIKMVFRMN